MKHYVVEIHLPVILQSVDSESEEAAKKRATDSQFQKYLKETMFPSLLKDKNWDIIITEVGKEKPCKKKRKP